MAKRTRPHTPLLTGMPTLRKQTTTEGPKKHNCGENTAPAKQLRDKHIQNQAVDLTPKLNKKFIKY